MMGFFYAVAFVFNKIRTPCLTTANERPGLEQLVFTRLGAAERLSRKSPHLVARPMISVSKLHALENFDSAQRKFNGRKYRKFSCADNSMSFKPPCD